jgi:hypothetical protein
MRASLSDVAALELSLQSSLGAAARVSELRAALSPAQPPAVRRAALAALRRVFTRYFHEGVMAGAAVPAAAAGGATAALAPARKRACAGGADAPSSSPAAAALAAWLHGEFRLFRAELAACLLEARTAGEAADAPDNADLAADALATAAHFVAHARAAPAAADNARLCSDALDWCGAARARDRHDERRQTLPPNRAPRALLFYFVLFAGFCACCWAALRARSCRPARPRLRGLPRALRRRACLRARRARARRPPPWPFARATRTSLTTCGWRRAAAWRGWRAKWRPRARGQATAATAAPLRTARPPSLCARPWTCCSASRCR